MLFLTVWLDLCHMEAVRSSCRERNLITSSWLAMLWPASRPSQYGDVNFALCVLCPHALSDFPGALAVCAHQGRGPVQFN